MMLGVRIDKPSLLSVIALDEKVDVVLIFEIVHAARDDVHVDVVDAFFRGVVWVIVFDVDGTAVLLSDFWQNFC